MSCKTTCPNGFLLFGSNFNAVAPPCTGSQTVRCGFSWLYSYLCMYMTYIHTSHSSSSFEYLIHIAFYQSLQYSYLWFAFSLHLRRFFSPFTCLASCPQDYHIYNGTCQYYCPGAGIPVNGVCPLNPPSRGTSMAESSCFLFIHNPVSSCIHSHPSQSHVTRDFFQSALASTLSTPSVSFRSFKHSLPAMFCWASKFRSVIVAPHI